MLPRVLRRIHSALLLRNWKVYCNSLPKFASGFDTQNGAIFEFGPSAELEPTGNVLKFSNTDSNTLDKLDTHMFQFTILLRKEMFSASTTALQYLAKKTWQQYHDEMRLRQLVT